MMAEREAMLNAKDEKIPVCDKLQEVTSHSTFTKFFSSAQKAGDLSKEASKKADKTNEIKNEFYSANKRH